MLRGLTGHYIPISTVGEPCKAFIPQPLPPNPPLPFDAALHDLLTNAALAVGRLDGITTIGKAAGSALRLHEYLQCNPITSTGSAAEATGLSVMTCGTILRKLQAVHLVREVTGGKYGRLYAYDEYLKILSEGTEPLPGR